MKGQVTSVSPGHTSRWTVHLHWHTMGSFVLCKYFGLWKEAGVHVHIPPRKVPEESNPESSCWESTVPTTTTATNMLPTSWYLIFTNLSSWHQESWDKVSKTKVSRGVGVKFLPCQILTGNCLRFLPGLPILQEALFLANFSSVLKSMSSIVLSPCEQKEQHHDLDKVSCNNWSNRALVYGNFKAGHYTCPLYLCIQ